MAFDGFATIFVMNVVVFTNTRALAVEMRYTDRCETYHESELHHRLEGHSRLVLPKTKETLYAMYFCLYTGHWFSSVMVLESTARVMKDWEKLWQSEAMWLSLTIMVRNIYFLLGWNYMQDNYLSFSCCTYHKIYSTRHDRAKMARYH